MNTITNSPVGIPTGIQNARPNQAAFTPVAAQPADSVSLRFGMADAEEGISEQEAEASYNLLVEPIRNEDIHVDTINLITRKLANSKISLEPEDKALFLKKREAIVSFETAFHKWNIEQMKALIEQYPGLTHVTNIHGKTPLHQAIFLSNVSRKSAENYEFAKFLVAKGADVNAPDKNGYAPGYWTKSSFYNSPEQREAIELLKRAGATDLVEQGKS